MTEEAQNERQFSIQRIYTKDISFETPNSPLVFTQEWKPEINVTLNTNTTKLDGDAVEVILTVNVEAKHADKTSFLVELQQAGIFHVSGFSDEELSPLLLIGAPTALFPYAREAISDLVTRGSFPQFVLQPVNFEALYAQQMQSQETPADAEKH